MSNTQTRRALHAYLSDEAHEQWHEFAATQGVSVSALLEIFSSRLAPDPTSDISYDLESMVAEARRLDAARRRRRPSGAGT